MTKEQHKEHNAIYYPASVLTWLNEATDRVFKEFEDRNCENCKHKYIVDSMTTECRDNDSPIDYLDLECFPEFSCNRWEQK